MTGVPTGEVTLIVAGNPSTEQTRVLLDLPARPMVHRRRGGNAQVTFPMNAPDMSALLAAVDAVESVGLRTLRVVDNDWMTLGAIAARLGVSRETVRLWSLGRCGPGGFPPPLNPGQDTSFYSWYAVATWLRGYRPRSLPAPNPAPVAVNLVLQLRQIGAPAAVQALPRLLPAGTRPCNRVVAQAGDLCGPDDVHRTGAEDRARPPAACHAGKILSHERAMPLNG